MRIEWWAGDRGGPERGVATRRPAGTGDQEASLRWGGGPDGVEEQRAPPGLGGVVGSAEQTAAVAGRAPSAEGGL
jgi:hypothetical protein